MSESIKIFDYIQVKASFADFEYFDFSTSSAPVNKYDSIHFIINSLAKDILYTRTDRPIDVEFDFKIDGFEITLSFSYPYFYKNSNFKFNYDYPDLKENINSIIANVLNKAVLSDNFQHQPTDIKESQKFFKNIFIFEQLFNMEGELHKHLNEKPFRSGLGFVKDKFKFYTLNKYMNGSPSIELICPIFEVGITSVGIKFEFEGVEITFKNELIRNIYDISALQNVVISLFNSNKKYNVNTISELKSISEIISI